MLEDSSDLKFDRRDALRTLGFLGCSTLAGCAALQRSVSMQPRDLTFSEISAEIDFDYTPRGDWVGNGHSGVYVNDFNNDLWPDVLAIGGEVPVLFKNEGGTFRESTALPDIDRQIIGALFFDHNNNGREDLLLLAENDSPVFLENVDGEFAVRDCGFHEELTRPVGATAADYDRDGALEVFIYQYGNWGETAPAGYLNRGEIEDDNGFKNYLYAYDGSAFRVVEDAGIKGTHWSLASSFVDFTGNSLPDIHVANDFNNDILYLNQADGTFKRTRLGSVTDRNAMSSEVVDMNGDGQMDLFVTNIDLPIQEGTLTEEQYQLVRDRVKFLLGKRIEGNNLLINDGDGEFTDSGETYGIQEGGWGWAAIITDFDNDANLDVFHTTSIFFRIDRNDPHYTYSMIWQGGESDQQLTQLDASEIGLVETSGRGAAHLDVDLDGRQDIAVATFNEDYVFYANETDAGNCVQLRAKSGTRDSPSIGANVTVTSDGRRQIQAMNCNVDYQSQDSRYLHFGLGKADKIDKIEVVWPAGEELTLTDISANQRLVVTPDGIHQSRRLE